MTTLPVRQMVLYKHGVGFFVRSGAFSGESAPLTFRQDEINDVLKSLAVFDRAGGQVLGIHYQTPMDRETRLANSSIRLSDTSSLRDLLRDLRGRRITLGYEVAPGSQERVSGRVVGVDTPLPMGNNAPAKFTLTLLGVDGALHVLDLDSVRQFSIDDAQADDDLAYFLDTSTSEDTRRAINVRLSPGEHDLAVYYVAPSPTWRVSYRIVAETAESGETGDALLQGWGLFDNRLEEDLQDVKVTLVAGQPISFIYDLYASNIPKRPYIKEQARVATGPIEYEGTTPDFDSMTPNELMTYMESLAKRQGAYEGFVAGAAMDMPSPDWLSNLSDAAPAPMMAAAPAPQPPPRMRKEAMQQSTQAQAEGREGGETFAYDVTTPVTVKRGESALVPILGSDVNYRRELLYNRSKLATHPVAALRFKNTTKLTLERGPVTVVENGDYKGEAILPFTKDEGEIYLPYAVELGVRVREDVQNRHEIHHLSISGQYLVIHEYQIISTTYTLENTTTRPLTITIEAPLLAHYELHETRAADAETLNERRWKVAAPPRAKTRFERKERTLVSRHEQLRNLNYDRLSAYLRDNLLDQRTYERLHDLLDQQNRIAQAQREIQRLENERKQHYTMQEQARANLGSLSASGKEAALRDRVLKQLENAQDRIEAIEREIEAHKSRITQAEQAIEAILKALN